MRELWTRSSLCFPSLGVLAETPGLCRAVLGGGGGRARSGTRQGEPGWGCQAQRHRPGTQPGPVSRQRGGSGRGPLQRPGPGRARAAPQGPHRPTAVPALVWRRQEPLPERSLQPCALTARSPLRAPPQPPTPEGAMVPTRWLCGVKHQLLSLPMYPNYLVTTIFDDNQPSSKNLGASM